MQASEIKRVAERQPFRPFGLRLTNGAEYYFTEPRQFGAPGNFRTIFFFDQDDWVLIDSDTVVEVFGNAPNGG